jgi:hypothetical protein
MRGPRVRAEGRDAGDACSDRVGKSSGGEGSKGGIKAVVEEWNVVALSCRVEQSTGVRVVEESVVVVGAVVKFELSVDAEASRASRSKSASLTTVWPAEWSY